jgi:hypothetical protein
MKCINNYLIQKYIDGEATEKEVQLINNHLKKCASCISKLENRQILSKNVISATNKIIIKEIVTPKFLSPVNTLKKQWDIKKHIIIYIAAASILTGILVLYNHKINKHTPEIYSIQNTTEDVNANQPCSEQKITLKITDPQGNTTEYNLD